MKAHPLLLGLMLALLSCSAYASSSTFLRASAPTAKACGVARLLVLIPSDTPAEVATLVSVQILAYLTSPNVASRSAHRPFFVLAILPAPVAGVKWIIRRFSSYPRFLDVLPIEN